MAGLKWKILCVCFVVLLNDQLADAQSMHGTVTDITGVTYETITIGNQTWMAENLRTSQLNNGTPIPYVFPKKKWNKTNAPAFSLYYFNSHDELSTDSIKIDNIKDSIPLTIDHTLEYHIFNSTRWSVNTTILSLADYKKCGYLYNFKCVETNKLCPVGWHVPTVPEWDTLLTHLGGPYAAYNTLYNGYFNIQMAGSRLQGDFYFLSFGAMWWTPNILTKRSAYTIYVNRMNKRFASSKRGKRTGASVRCIMNKQ